MPQIKNISACDGLYIFPLHLGKRSNGLKGPKLSPHPLGKRSPSADPGGVSLSVTANMDTLRNRLLWSLHNNHKQVSHELGTAQTYLSVIGYASVWACWSTFCWLRQGFSAINMFMWLTMVRCFKIRGTKNITKYVFQIIKLKDIVYTYNFTMIKY